MDMTRLTLFALRESIVTRLRSLRERNRLCEKRRWQFRLGLTVSCFHVDSGWT